MSTKILSAAISVIIVGSAALLAWQFDVIPTPAALPFSSPQNTSGSKTASTTQSIATPGPLKQLFKKSGATLTVSGVLTETNYHRATEGAATLQLNATLSAAAKAKLEDMFAQQYFEHVSPSGRGPSDVIESAGYTYITVGENLALGNFDSDQALVQAWMDSPGHRENILSTRFQEIGIAVAKGVFEGQETWIAVQEFGTPLSNCPSPNPSTEQQIQSVTDQVDAQKVALDEAETAVLAQQAEIERIFAEVERLAENEEREEARALQEEGRSLLDQFESDRAAYNSDVEAFNAKQETLQSLVSSYNVTIQTFNACISNFTND